VHLPPDIFSLANSAAQVLKRAVATRTSHHQRQDFAVDAGERTGVIGAHDAADLFLAAAAYRKKVLFCASFV
jgi:hypothetical protein